MTGYDVFYIQVLNRLAAKSLNHRGSGGFDDRLSIFVTDKAWLLDIDVNDNDLDWAIYDNDGCHRLSGTVHKTWTQDLRVDLFAITWYFECLYNILLTAQD